MHGPGSGSRVAASHLDLGFSRVLGDAHVMHTHIHVPTRPQQPPLAMVWVTHMEQLLPLLTTHVLERVVEHKADG